VRSGTFIKSFDSYAQVLSFAVKTNRKIWSGDFVENRNNKTELRAAQRNLRFLEKAGYLIGDDCMPKGYKPTRKAKEMFGGVNLEEELLLGQGRLNNEDQEVCGG
jgi:hypothetical protein